MLPGQHSPVESQEPHSDHDPQTQEPSQVRLRVWVPQMSHGWVSVSTAPGEHSPVESQAPHSDHDPQAQEPSQVRLRVWVPQSPHG
jgi:hypothetical protein